MARIWNKHLPKRQHISFDVLKGKRMLTKSPQGFCVLILVSRAHKAGVGTYSRLSSHFALRGQLWSLGFKLHLICEMHDTLCILLCVCEVSILCM